MPSIALACVAAFVTACMRPERPPPDAAAADSAITVGSFNFTENVILAEIYAQALESGGYPVKRALDLGPRELVEPALEKRLVEFVPEYLGSALAFLAPDAADDIHDPERTHKRLVRACEKRGVAVLAPAPAEDTNGIVVTRETAKRYGLKKVSDLVPFAGELVFGGPPECPERPLCLPGLEETYGLVFKRFVPLDVSGPLTSAALVAGQVDVALLFTTNEAIAVQGFVVLEDDRNLQPAENITPLVREEVIRDHGRRLVRLVDDVSRRLTTEDLIRLNRLVALEGKSPRVVARDWLERLGLDE